jgi:integrase
MISEQADKKTESVWQKTNYANLWRYVPSGTLYARMRVDGKLIVKSLKTDVISVGKLRLADMEKAERASAEDDAEKLKGKLTFGAALAVYQERMEKDVRLKPKSKAYYKERISALKKSWPGLLELDVRKIGKRECLEWATNFAETSSPTAYNNTAAVLRSVLDVATELGARYDNPARHIQRRSPKAKKLRLPSQDQFAAWLEKMDSFGDGWCIASANLVRFLAYGGFRIGEASEISWADCDFARGRIHVRGHAEDGTKNGEDRWVPMIPEMRALLERIKPADVVPTARVMRVKECQGTMDRALAKVEGMARITHHDLRHLFATRCIESGVDIPTVSRWMGHKDGGALAMKTYGHLRDEHSTDMAARVSFGAVPAATNIVPLAAAAA